MTAHLQCAAVHSIRNAHSHIAENSAHYPAQTEGKKSLKALSCKVLRRTFSRTLSAQCKEEPRTLPAHYRVENDPPRTLQNPVRLMPSPVALEWLRDHRQELRQVGWTMAELYRRNKSQGICWAGIWDKPFFKAYLHDDGIIECEFVDGGRDVIQTARPENYWLKK